MKQFLHFSNKQSIKVSLAVFTCLLLLLPLTSMAQNKPTNASTNKTEKPKTQGKKNTKEKKKELALPTDSTQSDTKNLPSDTTPSFEIDGPSSQSLLEGGNDGGGGGGGSSVDCVLSEWSEWSECDSECGQQSRTRTVITPASNGGNACGDLIEYRTCDLTPPTINCPGNITVNSDPAMCGAVVIFDAPTANDNCSIDSVTQIAGIASGGIFPVGTTTNTFEAKDAAGNTQTCSFTVTVVDNEKPKIERTSESIPVLYLDDNCSAIVGDYTYLVTATDNCSGIGNISQRPVAGTVETGYKGFLYIYFDVSDAANNRALSYTVKLIKKDTTAPVPPTPPANITIECAESIPQAIDLTATDGCDGDITVSPTDVKSLLEYPQVGYKIVRTWTFQDESGNKSSISQEITVTDTTPPTITCVANQTKSTDAGKCYYTVSGTEFDPTAYDDNCNGPTIKNDYNGESTLEGATFPFGETTVTWTVKDAADNETSCSFVVNVNKITTTTSVTVTPSTQQYSDTVTLTAKVAPYECGVSGGITGTVTFMIGSQKMGTASIVDGKAELVNVPLLEPSPFGTAPTGQMAPGIQTVTAQFNALSSDYNITDPTTSLKIAQEDANVEYTGQSLQATPSSSSSTATVLLSANIQDMADGSRGDIRNAKVKFVNRDNNSDISGWIPVANLIDSNDNTLGTVSFPWVVSIIGNSESFTVGIVVDGYYFRDSSEDDTVITIYKPVGDFITGGGYIRSNSSSGQYASTSGLKTNFGFNIGYNKKGNKLQGHINVLFRRLENDGKMHVYQIKSNSTQSLGVDISDASAKYATFITKTSLMDITDPLNIISISGNLILKVTMTDRGEPGTYDSIGFDLSDGGTLLYSSKWVGIKTSELQLSAGNLVVHSGYSTGSTSKSTQSSKVAQDEILDTSFEVIASPNPSDAQFNIKVKTINTIDKISITVFDVNGRMVHSNVFNSKQLYSFGNELESGIYFITIAQKDQHQSVKVVKF